MTMLLHTGPSASGCSAATGGGQLPTVLMLHSPQLSVKTWGGGVGGGQFGGGSAGGCRGGGGLA